MITETGPAARTLQTQTRFRRLLDALAWPGRIMHLAEASPFPLAPARYPVAIADTLLDHEMTFAVIGSSLHPVDQSMLVERLRLRTGAWPVEHSAAQFVLVFGAPGTALREVHTGDPEFPERGATLIWRVDGFGRGTAATLRGPGIDGVIDVALAGVGAEDFATLAAINRAYPCGLDTFFVDDRGAVLGLPRSTHISLQTEPAPPRED